MVSVRAVACYNGWQYVVAGLAWCGVAKGCMNVLVDVTSVCRSYVCWSVDVGNCSRGDQVGAALVALRRWNETFSVLYWLWPAKVGGLCFACVRGCNKEGNSVFSDEERMQGRCYTALVSVCVDDGNWILL